MGLSSKPQKYIPAPSSRPARKKCAACNGSGRYDHNGSPKCAACGGSGKENRND